MHQEDKMQETAGARILTFVTSLPQPAPLDFDRITF